MVLLPAIGPYVRGLALSVAKCQSNGVTTAGIEVEDGRVVVRGKRASLTYTSRRVIVDGPDGRTVLEHESRGGTLSSVWAADLGGRYVEVVHLADGPAGGELVLVVPGAGLVALGDLAGPETDGASASWAEAVDLALGLTENAERILGATGEVTRDDLEDLQQRLLATTLGR